MGAGTFHHREYVDVNDTVQVVDRGKKLWKITRIEDGMVPHADLVSARKKKPLLEINNISTRELIKVTDVK